MKILYVCAWDKKKERTWSGTTFSLFKALGRKTNVLDKGILLNRYENLVIKLSSFKVIGRKIRNVTSFNKSRDYFFQKKLDKYVENDSESIVFHVGNSGICDNQSYSYIDLSIDSLYYFKEKKPELFQYSSFENIPLTIIDDKRKRQKVVFENLNGIFTMSKWLANNLVEYSGLPKEKVHWVGGGINLDISKIELHKKTNNKILFVGRDFFRKGGDLVYKAFKELRKELPEAELYIAGPSKWPLDECDENVIFLGDISYDKLSEYFNKCDIFCMPSRFEAYGLVFIEALVYGLPCIGRNEFEMKEFIKEGENGFLIDVDDELILANKMKELLSNKEIKENVVNSREEYIKMYSWDTVADRIMKVLIKDKSKRS